MAASCVLLGACEVLFPLEDAETNACSGDDLALCLAFEDSFDDGFARDFTSGRHDAALTNVVAVEREPGERAAEIQSGGDIVLPYGPAAFDLPLPYSIDLWVKWTPQLVEQLILDNKFQYTIFLKPHFTTPMGEAGFIECGNRTDGVPEFQNGPVDQPQDGAWHHVACVYDGSTVTGYIDGRPGEARAQSGQNLSEGTFDLTLGHAGGAVEDRPFVGAVDNVRLWTRALSADEVVDFANGRED